MPSIAIDLEENTFAHGFYFTFAVHLPTNRAGRGGIRQKMLQQPPLVPCVSAAFPVPFCVEFPLPFLY
jgi:hypothetical protein